jgi:osmotically inducible protein OsmC
MPGGKGAFDMSTRRAHARWEGSIKEGKGNVELGSGACKSAYSFSSRFEDGTGTNPEELLGAAHASCFAMALSLALGRAGFRPEYVDAIAEVTIVPREGGFKITKSHLICEADVPGIDPTSFVQHAETAKKTCPVSQALTGTELTLDVKLARRDVQSGAQT